MTKYEFGLLMEWHLNEEEKTCPSSTSNPAWTSVGLKQDFQSLNHILEIFNKHMTVFNI